MTSPTASDPLADLSAAGVAVWLDDLSRELLAGGELRNLIEHRHVVGVTTNPTIFASALAKGERYSEQLRQLARQGANVDEAVFALTTDDVRAGCQALAAVHLATGGLDGRVSIEVDPRLAGDADATVEQARKLWTAVDQPNLLIKIPATREGLRAITDVIARGISVNVTLIFSLDRYREVLDAYLSGLEQALAQGHDLAGIYSVASFFVSRVDTEVDARLDAVGTPEAQALRGGAAVANARLAHQMFEQISAEPRWQALAAAGAHPQRPLWASTGVKDPAYADTLYVEELVVAGTVNTMPGATLAAFADHGAVTRHAPAADDFAAARAHIDALADVGVDFADVTDTLEREGVTKFERSWEELGATVARELGAGTGTHDGTGTGTDTGAHDGTGTRGGTGREDSAAGPLDASDAADLLAIYLNDHLGGATGGLELLRRAAQAQQDREWGAALADLVKEVERDRESLLQMMTDLGVSIDRSKIALGWLAEKAGRLKPNGHLFSRSPLSDVLELESMRLGVDGKASCWRTLRTLADSDGRLYAEYLDSLLEGAARQAAALEEMRGTAAARAFTAAADGGE